MKSVHSPVSAVEKKERIVDEQRKAVLPVPDRAGQRRLYFLKEWTAIVNMNDRNPFQHYGGERPAHLGHEPYRDGPHRKPEI